MLPPYNCEASLASSASLDADRGRKSCAASDGRFAGGVVEGRRRSVATMSSKAERTCSSKASASGVARRSVAARRATKRSRSAERVDDGASHSFVSGAGTGAGHDARRGRGGAAGGPSSISGAVWGAKDARRLGGGLSGCSAATGCCPFAAPSAPLVVGAASSMSRLQSLSVQRWRSFWSPSHIITCDRRSTRPPVGFTAFHAYRARNEWVHEYVSTGPTLKNKTGTVCRRAGAG